MQQIKECSKKTKNKQTNKKNKQKNPPEQTKKMESLSEEEFRIW